MPILALKLFETLGRSRRSAWGWMILIWVVLIVPAMALRGLHYEEGTIIALARGALEDGHWLVPHHYGLRFPERPALMSWVVAALGWMFGGITPEIARVPAVLSLLGGGALVFYLVRQRASPPAALFGALCFFVSPALLQKLITAEPDAMVSVLLFATFVVWWDGYKTGQVTLPRWIAAGLVLTAAALTKGPQPVAYFTLGIGLFLAIKGRWRDLPGFFLANAIAGVALLAWYGAAYRPGDIEVWLHYSRLHAPPGGDNYFVQILRFIGQFMLEALPGLLVAVPLAVGHWCAKQAARDDLTTALLCYALTVTLILLVWPGSGTRYAMPAIPAVASLAGLGFDALRNRRPRLVDISAGLAIVLVFYADAIGWVAMPLRPDLFARSRVGAELINAELRSSPGTLYCSFDTLNNNILGYVPAPIRTEPVEAIARERVPLWAYLGPGEAEKLRALRPDLALTLRVTVHVDTVADLYQLAPK